MTTLLQAQNLNFSWNRTRWFDDFSLDVEGGHIYGLMGKNGAGKTTLLKLLIGCVQPKSGSVRIQTASGLTMEAFSRQPACMQEMVFVAENSELPNLTAHSFGELAGALYPRFSMSQFNDFLRGLAVDPRKRLPKMSFGQRRKCHIAFALATNASLVFLDEPSNGLDIAAQIVLRKLLIAQASPNRALIISTHHVREFENVIDRIIVLDQGKLIANEITEDLANAGIYKDLESWYAAKIGVHVDQYLPKGN